MSRVRGFSGLTWVSGELGLVIREARDALEKYLEDDSDNSTLATAIAHLSQVRGVLQMLHLSGAARLAEEMQASAKAMLDAKVKDSQETEPLMLALILLPDYIEKLEVTDSEDLPALLLDPINDLRRSRGASLLQESDLIIADLIQSMAVEHVSEAAANDLQAFAKQIRPRLHKGLLTWLKGPNHSEGIFLLGEVFGELAQQTQSTPLLNGMLCAAQAITIGLIEGSIQEDKQIKALIGRVDRNIKELAEQGLHAASKSILPEQFHELLRVVAGAKSTDSVITKVQNDYDLARIFPSEEKIADGQRWLVAPSTTALSGVRTAVIKELMPIKDTLDLFKRGGSLAINQLEDLAVPVQRLANTLEMVGLGELGRRLHGRSMDLKAIGTGEIPADEDLLMGIAADFLLVESHLGNTTGDADGEMRSLVIRTLKEAALDMAKAKQAIVTYIDSPSNMRSLEATPALFHGVSGALRVVAHSDAANILDQARSFIQQAILSHNVIPDQPILDSLAECIAGIEYYMEAVADGRSDVANILEISANALQRLLVYGKGDESLFSSMLDIPNTKKVSSKSLEQDETEEIGSTQPSSRFILPDVDPEIMEIFLEEAKETELDIRQSFGRWRSDNNDSEALTSVRRSFHTLKGSGRLAKAMEIGEFAYMVENLLNRVIDQTIPTSSAVLLFVGQAIDAIPELIQAQEQHRGSRISLTEFTRRADELLGKRPAKDSNTSNLKNQTVPEPSTVVAKPIETEHPFKTTEVDSFFVESAFDDPVLRDIFEKEATQHLNTIDSFLNNSIGKPPPYLYDNAVVRALHTLAGSAHMAGISAIATLAKALERKAEYLLSVKLGADVNFFALLQESANSIRGMISTLGEPGIKLDSQDLVTRVTNYVCPPPIIPSPVSIDLPQSQSSYDINQDIFAESNSEKLSNLGTLDNLWANETAESGDIKLDLNELYSTEISTDSGYSIDVGNVWDVNTDDEQDFPRIDLNELNYNDPEPTNTAEITFEGDYSSGLGNLWDVAPASAESTNDTPKIDTEDDYPGLDNLWGAAPASAESAADIPKIDTEDDYPGLDNLWGAAPVIAESAADTPKIDTEDDYPGLDNLWGAAPTDAESHADTPKINIKDDYLGIDNLGDTTPANAAIAVDKNDYSTSFDNLWGADPTSTNNAPDISATIIDDDYSINLDNSWSVTPINGENYLEISNKDEVDSPKIQISSLIVVDDSVEEEEFADLEGDPELHEIFPEEAQELLELLEKVIAEWISSPNDPAFSKETKRILHTLKGSGRVAGVKPVGNLSQALETLVYNLTPKLIQANPQVFLLVNKGIKRLYVQIEQVRSGGPVAKALVLITELETAHKNLTTQPQPQQSIPETPKQVDTVHHEEVISAPKSPIAVQPVAHHEPEVTFLPPHTTIVDEQEALAGGEEVRGIFLEEAVDLLGHLDNDLREWIASQDDPSFPNKIKRVLHTLKGSARSAEIRAIGTLSHTLETLLDGLTPELLKKNAGVLDLAQRAVDMLAEQVDQVRFGGPVAKALPLLADLVDTHELVMGHKPQITKPDDHAVPRTLAEEFEPLNGELEIREAFLEDAKDLLEQLNTNLQEWFGAQDDFSFTRKIKHVLHTIKGSARSAGIFSVGTLSHALETLLDGLTPELLKTQPHALSLAQQAADRLAEQVEHVRDGYPVPKALPLVKELETAHDKLTGNVSLPPPPLEQPAPIDGGDASKGSKPDEGIESKKSTTGQQTAQKLVRIRSDLLDNLISNAGEINIYQARLEQYNSTLGFNLSELRQTVERLHRQLREMTAKTEEQISFRKGDVKEEQKETVDQKTELDPLEMDRFSTLQLLSRTLSETVGDLQNIRNSLEEQQKEAVTLLVQNSRISNHLQDGLLRTRMVPFSQSVPELQRVVRQTALSLKKQAELVVVGAEGQMDRNILDRIIPALGHILRNAVGHGIELPEKRLAAGKPKIGKITITLARDGNEILLTVADDGNGLNLPAIRKRALERNLIKPGTTMNDNDVMQLILEPGFSTAEAVSEISGRGVGTDVAVSEVKQLGGSLEISSEFGKGASFLIRLPFTLAITQALLIRLDKDTFAVPHSTMEGVVRIGNDELKKFYSGEKPGFEYMGRTYPVRYLGTLLSIPAIRPTEGYRSFPHLLVRSGEHRMAIQVDQIIGHRQIVMKSVGPQLSSVRWISGGTILVDGRVALILDVSALVRMDVVQTAREITAKIHADRKQIVAMVVDDSVTVRKVTTNVLTRKNMAVITATDGVDAIAKLQSQQPDVMLLDVEMPRMDGYELARHMRNSPDARVRKIPIIMITSRIGDTHREIGLGLGVKRYLGKPYQENDLLEDIYSVLAETEMNATT